MSFKDIIILLIPTFFAYLVHLVVRWKWFSLLVLTVGVFIMTFYILSQPSPDHFYKVFTFFLTLTIVAVVNYPVYLILVFFTTMFIGLNRKNMSIKYGVEDASYIAAGELEGLTKLSDDFYDAMQTLPEAKTILNMHKDDLTISRKKLAYFLSGWLGGPRIYPAEFGPIRIPMAHKHLPIVNDDGNAWLLCMQKALEKQDYADDFKEYLIAQLAVPASRVAAICK